MKKKQGIFKIMFRIFSTLRRYEPKEVSMIFLIAVVYACISPLEIYLTKNIFSEAASIAGKVGNSTLIIKLIILLIVVSLFRYSLGAIYSPLFSYTANRFSFVLQREVSRLLMRLPLDIFEVKATYNDVNKAMQGAENAQNVAMQVLASIVDIGILLTVTAYLMSLHPALALVLLFVNVPPVVRYLIESTQYQQLRNRTVPVRRECEYYQDCFTKREYFKDTRLLGAARFFFDMWMASFKFLNKEQWKTDMKIQGLSFTIDLASIIGYGASFILSVYLLYSGKIGIGEFGAMILASISMSNDLQGIIWQARAILKDSSLTADYYTFLDSNYVYEKKDVVKTLPSSEEIILENVYYTYPMNEKPALNRINLTIRKGEKLAIVGVNGSGKTTLIKVISGLFVPNPGTVYYDGIDLSKVDPEAVFRGITAVFQNYSKYLISVGENTGISDVKYLNDEQRLHEALNKGNFPISIAKFNHGLNTQLGREFGGEELSGGEWQKLAIARGFFRAHDVVIFDEPTAAIDTLLEREIHNRFVELSRDKTALLVTHRLGSARMADRIVVMEAGKIIEEGSHEELLQMKGEYAEMFQAQARWV